MEQENECLFCGEDFTSWDDEEYCNKCEVEND